MVNCINVDDYELEGYFFSGFKTVRLSGIKQGDVKEPGFKEVRVRWLITRGDGGENFAVR